MTWHVFGWGTCPYYQDACRVLRDRFPAPGAVECHNIPAFEYSSALGELEEEIQNVQPAFSLHGHSSSPLVLMAEGPEQGQQVWTYVGGFDAMEQTLATMPLPAADPPPLSFPRAPAPKKTTASTAKPRAKKAGSNSRKASVSAMNESGPKLKGRRHVRSLTQLHALMQLDPVPPPPPAPTSAKPARRRRPSRL